MAGQPGSSIGLRHIPTCGERDGWGSDGRRVATAAIIPYPVAPCRFEIEQELPIRRRAGQQQHRRVLIAIQRCPFQHLVRIGTIHANLTDAIVVFIVNAFAVAAPDGMVHQSHIGLRLHKRLRLDQGAHMIARKVGHPQRPILPQPYNQVSSWLIASRGGNSIVHLAGAEVYLPGWPILVTIFADQYGMLVRRPEKDVAFIELVIPVMDSPYLLPQVGHRATSTTTAPPRCIGDGLHRLAAVHINNDQRTQEGAVVLIGGVGANER